jgi:hypothetical protein
VCKLCERVTRCGAFLKIVRSNNVDDDDDSIDTKAVVYWLRSQVKVHFLSNVAANLFAPDSMEVQHRVMALQWLMHATT